MSVWYLNPTSGNDSTGNGSLATPYKTVTKCEAVATIGDEAVIIDGTHILAASDTPTLAKLRTVRSQGGIARNCVINGNNAYAMTITMATSGVNYYIKNFTYKNNVSATYFLVIRGTATNAYVSNVIMTEFRTTGTYSSGLILISTVSGIIDIRNCVFDAPVASITGYIIGTWSGGGFFRSSTLNIINNVFVYKTGFPNMVFVDCAGAVVLNFKNNIVVNNVASGCTVFGYINGNEAGTTIAVNDYNNDYYTTGGTITKGNLSGATLTSSGNIAVDPLFISSATVDYRLRPTSPCIGVGVAA